MARGCSGSDSEEERHDRFRSERNNSSLNASKSLFSTGLQPKNKSRSPLRRLNSPSRRDCRSTSKRSRSRSERRSKERKIKERRGSREKSKKESEKNRRSSSKSKETRRTEYASEIERGGNRRRSRSIGSSGHDCKERKRKKESRRKNTEKVGSSSDTFLERFERRRPSVEIEIVENTVTYRETSTEPELRFISSTSCESKFHSKKKTKNTIHGDAEEGEVISEEENNCFGPALPPRIVSDEEDGEVAELVAEGPALPPGFNNRCTPELTVPESSPIQEVQLDSNMSILPDSSKKEKEAPIIGPTLPPRESLPSLDEQEDEADKALYGPALPPAQPSPTVCQEEEVFIGPLPEGTAGDDRVQRILEERAQSIRKQMENKDSGGENDLERKGRECWMVELPDIKTVSSLGLGPRKFRTREGPDLSDRSSWTDIPGSKQSKQENLVGGDEDTEDSRRLKIAARNEEMELKAKQSSSNRDKSLLQMHQKELKKKRKKELEKSGGKLERRPFSREIDLQTNRFDEAQRRSIINKAQLLDTRFFSGENKYL